MRFHAKVESAIVLLLDGLTAFACICQILLSSKVPRSVYFSLLFSLRVVGSGFPLVLLAGSAFPLSGTDRSCRSPGFFLG